MSDDQIRTILVAIAEVKVEVKNIAKAADKTHADHEIRIRALETAKSENQGVWRVLTAGGVVGAVLCAAALKLLGL